MLEKLLLAAAITALVNLGLTLKLPGTGPMASDRDGTPSVGMQDLSWQPVNPNRVPLEDVH